MADLVEDAQWSLVTSSRIGAYVAEAQIEKAGVRLSFFCIKGEAEYSVSLSVAEYPKLDEQFRSAPLMEVLRSIGVEPSDHDDAFTLASLHLNEIKKHVLYRAKRRLPRVYKTMIACLVFGLGWIFSKHFLVSIAH
ncbi:hypothetical protein [Sphingomonas koreensis]|uniref:hypothetical protein n=1 Tax=Sphingomonas koreensis TaxID=93064 RepID=UPI000835E3D9|nr:hypothetical protein [Sphingomonas koreensis]RSU58226.1 hypothetical protein DAH56_16200 [Sphingomonas koreensis]